MSAVFRGWPGSRGNRATPGTGIESKPPWEFLMLDELIDKAESEIERAQRLRGYL